MNMKNLLIFTVLTIATFSPSVYGATFTRKADVDSITAQSNKEYQFGNYEEAIRLEEEALTTVENLLGKNNEYYATCLNDLAFYYEEYGESTKALNIGIEALKLRERLLGKNHRDYATSLCNLADYYNSTGNLQEAMRLGTEALELRERLVGKRHPDYAISLRNVADYYSTGGNSQKAYDLYMEVLDIQKATIGETHPDYAVTLNNLAGIYAELGNYLEAIRIDKTTLALRERILGKNHPHYVTTLSNLALDLWSIGNNAEAMMYGQEALNKTEKIYGKQNHNYATTLTSMASYKASAADYIEAINLSKEALDIIRNTLGKNHPDYARSLNNIGSYYYYLGNYTEALALTEEALEIYAESIGKKNYQYALAVDNLALYNAFSGNNEDAVRLGNIALEIWEEILTKDHPYYALSLERLSTYYGLSENYPEAIRISTEASRRLEKCMGKDNTDYATSINNLANYHSCSDNWTEALKLGLEVTSILERTVDKKHPNYIQSIANLANYSFHIGDTASLKKYATAANEMYIGSTRRFFADMTAGERRKFWEKYKPWFEKLINTYAFATSSPALVAAGYDATLTAKGILLSSERDLSMIISESGDSTAIDTYSNLRSVRNILDQLYKTPIKDRDTDLDSLEQKAKQLELDLIKQSKPYGDFTKRISIGWENVKASLKPNEVAVEFVSFPLPSSFLLKFQNTDNRCISGDSCQEHILYAAYVIKPDMQSPAMVPLFHSGQLKEIGSWNMYNTSDLSRLIWSPLTSYIDKSSDIYFAPSGDLYKIGIEYLPNYNGEGYMADRHKFHRLSSTRELALAGKRGKMSKAVLYGGLLYNTDISILEQDNVKYNQPETREVSVYNIADSIYSRSGVSDLPGTALEVKNISHSLECGNLQHLLYTKENGTEASFKALSGKDIDIIHIATHGFYWEPSKDNRGLNTEILRLMGQQLPLSTEEKALTRSGLIFSGANNALRGKHLPDHVQDGILTAWEIANLDFNRTQLVVMSACQSGLGEITGEGVFGLQRGFKKAGVDMLLMSLWKVDDIATQILMNKFYEDLIDGKSLHDALTESQKYLRDYMIMKEVTDSSIDEKGNITETTRKVIMRPYSNPRYWAAFILLDALDEKRNPHIR